MRARPGTYHERNVPHHRSADADRPRERTGRLTWTLYFAPCGPKYIEVSRKRHLIRMIGEYYRVMGRAYLRS